MHRLLVKCYLRLEEMELVGIEKMKEERDLLFNRKRSVQNKVSCTNLTFPIKVVISSIHIGGIQHALFDLRGL